MIRMITTAIVLIAAGSARADDRLRVEQPRVETLTDPVGLETTTPRFSWALAAERRGAQPTAYELQVASDRAALARGAADLWSTGRVDDARAWLVPYAGAPLRSRQRAFWRVRVWDDRGVASAWSGITSFELGLLAPSDWSAQWIGAPDAWYERRNREDPEHIDPPALASGPLLRRRFTLTANVRQARAYVAGLGMHELHVNGRKAGDRVLDPTYTNYDNRALYVVHDVSKLFRRGDNAVGIVLGNGRFHTLGKQPWKAHPRVRAQIEIELVDGSRVTIVTDQRWTMASGPWRIDGAKDVGETYDARRADDRWATVAADHGRDEPASLLTAPKGGLAAAVAPPVRVFETLAPRAITRSAPGVALFDFGQNTAGWVRLRVRAPAGTRIELRHAERLGPEGRLDLKGLVDQQPAPTFQRDVYVASGRGEEEWEPRFTYHGFRYVEVTGLPKAPTKATLVARVVHTDFETIGSVAASDPLVGALQRAFVWSYGANFVGIPTDCPHREKNGWTGDAHFAIDAGLYNFHNAAAYASWLRELRDAQRPDGSLPGMVPTGGFGYEDKWSGPTWDLALYLIPWRLYEHTGDRRELEQSWDAWMRHLAYLRGRASNFILSHGIGDWQPAKTPTPVDLMSTAAYFRAVDVARLAALALGRDEDAKKLAASAADVAGAFRRRFAPAGDLIIRTQAAIATALEFGLIVDRAARTRAIDALVADVHAKGDHLDAGINGAKSLIRALADGGHAELAYRVITQPTPPSWAANLAAGGTTLWEDWTGGGSLDHVYGGDVSAFFYRTLAGMEPAEPGWTHVNVRPHPVASLTFVDARVRSLRGTIAAGWKREGAGIVYDVQVPPGSRAKVALPAATADAITEGGRPLAQATGVRVLDTRDGRVTIETSSGSYRFRVRP